MPFGGGTWGGGGASAPPPPPPGSAALGESGHRRQQKRLSHRVRQMTSCNEVGAILCESSVQRNFKKRMKFLRKDCHIVTMIDS